MESKTKETATDGDVIGILDDSDVKLLSNKINPFYTDRNNREVFRLMIETHKKMKKKRNEIPMTLKDGEGFPLRVLEYACTTYAKEHEDATTEIMTADGKKIKVRIYDRYKRYLNIYQKRRFDMFGRKYSPNFKIKLEYKDAGVTLVSTLAQFNFFRFAIGEGVIDFIRKNYNAIANEFRDKKKTEKRRRTKDDTMSDTSTATHSKEGYSISFGFRK